MNITQKYSMLCHKPAASDVTCRRSPLFLKKHDPVDVTGADGRRYSVGRAGGIRYKEALPAYWPIRLGAEHALAVGTRPGD
jgi:hypothetical protein